MKMKEDLKGDHHRVVVRKTARVTLEVYGGQKKSRCRMEVSLWDDQLYGPHQQPTEEQAPVRDPGPSEVVWIVPRLLAGGLGTHQSMGCLLV